jgi:hypothetical protein
MNKTEIRKQYKILHLEIRDILFRCDPAHINLGGNKDEYDPEASTILPRLKEAKSESDVHDIVYEEFLHWFGENIAGDKDNTCYTQAAKEIRAAWQKFNSKLGI